MSDDLNARIIEAVARDMCKADGLDPDEKTTFPANRVLTRGEMWEGVAVDVAEPNWRGYRREAILLLAGMNAALGAVREVVDGGA